MRRKHELDKDEAFNIYLSENHEQDISQQLVSFSIKIYTLFIPFNCRNFK